MPGTSSAQPPSADAVADAFRDACRQELAALKPGNVHVHSPGHGLEVRDFELSADAAAPHIARAGGRVGARIRAAVDATWDAVATNTNLGIVLLCAPLAAAAETIRPGETLRAALARILARLDRQDATDAFAAIARANPAGLGRAPRGDVAEPASMTLLEAMRLAAPRDRIARAYDDGFADVFDLALPGLAVLRRSQPTAQLAVTGLHMSLLAAVPDSHIARKWGVATAEQVRREALALNLSPEQAIDQNTLNRLLDFDRSLKQRRLNPGTTADFVVATLFSEGLQGQNARSVSA